jgi:hypothetical protein
MVKVDTTAIRQGAQMKRLFCMAFTMMGLLAGDLTLAGQSKPSCWYLGADGFSEHEECLEQRGKDSLWVKPSHLRRLRFNDGYAAVLDKEHGWMVVNGKGEIVVQGVIRMYAIRGWASPCL